MTAESLSQKLGEWSFEVRADGPNLYIFVAHESLVPPEYVEGEPLCEPEEWSARLTVEPEWTGVDVDSTGHAIEQSLRFGYDPEQETGNDIS